MISNRGQDHAALEKQKTNLIYVSYAFPVKIPNEYHYTKPAKTVMLSRQ